MKKLIQCSGLAWLIAQTQAQSQYDPINDFCRRFSHQTAVIDNKLFIDGGYVDYGDQIDNGTANYTNTYLLWADLETVTDQNFPTLHADLSKPATVPSVAGGTLWADDVNKILWLYGGEYNLTAQVPPTYTVQFYDALYNTWNDTAEPPPSTITPPAYGASAVDPNGGMGYYYGGWNSNRTSALVGDGGEVASSKLVVFDFQKDTDRWTSRPAFNDTPRAEGGLFYIPASDGGMLVYLGGIQQSYDGTGATLGSRNYTGIPMNTVYIYDIRSGISYEQSTSTLAPTPRRRFCGGVSWPEDKSSYNIYIWGGVPPYETEGDGFDQVWILSIPSFTWTNFWSSTEPNPHHSSSCNVVAHGQMIVLGGAFPNTSHIDCDGPDTGGMHNLDLGEQNIADAPWYQYLTNITEYTLPSNLTAVIGGSSIGEATIKTPENGWDNEDLETLLPRVVKEGTRTATRSIPSTASPTPTNSPPPASSTKLSGGAIAGIVIGAIIGLALLLLAACICLRKRKRDRTTQRRPAVVTSDRTQDSSYQNSAYKQQMTSSSHVGSPGFSAQQSPIMQHAQVNHQPPQQYYPPPPQAQPYYPPPPAPQVDEQESPTYEMGNTRSPINIGDSTSPVRRVGMENTIYE